MMDVEVIEIENVVIDEKRIKQTTYSGVKNAWINCVENEAEKEIFIDRINSQLSLEPVPFLSHQESYHAKTLYDVLLEFDKNDKYGDLNENKINHTYAPNDEDLEDKIEFIDLKGIHFSISIEFPRWDEDLNWDSPTEILSKIEYGHFKISNIGSPDDFPWAINVTDPNNIIIEDDNGNQVLKNPDNLSDPGKPTYLQVELNATINSLTNLYLEKVKIIKKIICEVKEHLHENRNLCDDFFRFHALKIEEIILCSDIEIAADANVEIVEAEILLAISDFLAPKVYFLYDR